MAQTSILACDVLKIEKHTCMGWGRLRAAATYRVHQRKPRDEAGRLRCVARVMSPGRQAGGRAWWRMCRKKQGKEKSACVRPHADAHGSASAPRAPLHSRWRARGAGQGTSTRTPAIRACCCPPPTHTPNVPATNGCSSHTRRRMQRLPRLLTGTSAMQSWRTCLIMADATSVPYECAMTDTRRTPWKQNKRFGRQAGKGLGQKGRQGLMWRQPRAGSTQQTHGLASSARAFEQRGHPRQWQHHVSFDANGLYRRVQQLFCKAGHRWLTPSEWSLARLW